MMLSPGLRTVPFQNSSLSSVLKDAVCLKTATKCYLARGDPRREANLRPPRRKGQVVNSIRLDVPMNKAILGV